MRRMRDSLAGIVGDVRTSTVTIAGSADVIAAEAQDLSGRTERQAAALEETASSMEELTQTVGQNADHAHEASTLADQAAQVARRGGAVVDELVATMGAIDVSSKRIADIIGVIDGISFQTNIIALNAAVEAARAGEQGRGFAVVASEVRALAQRSATAAKEIKGLIDESTQRVEQGAVLAQKTGTTVKDIVGGIERVAGIMTGIVASSREQSNGIAQVTQSVAQMDQTRQQNAALRESGGHRHGPAGTGRAPGRADGPLPHGPAGRARRAASDGRLLRTVQRAQLVTVRIAHVREVQRPEAALAQARRRLDRRAAVCDGRVVERVDLFGRRALEADGGAVRARRLRTVDRFGDAEITAVVAVEQPVLACRIRVGERFAHAEDAQHGVVEAPRAFDVVGTDHDVTKHTYPF